MIFEKPKGQRLHKQFFGVKVDGFWWLPEYKEWYRETEDDGPFGKWFQEFLNSTTRSTFAPCRTVKAFKRMLRRHPWIKGKARLVSKFK